MRKIIDITTGNMREVPFTQRQLTDRVNRANEARIRAEAAIERTEARLQDIEDLKRATQIDQVVRLITRLIESGDVEE